MLLVKTKIGQSKIHGIGLFSDQFIPKGTLVQKFISGFDLVIPKSKIKKLSIPAKRQFLNYAYRHKKTGQFILCFDDARFLNHSDSPNLISNNASEEIDIAARNIRKGEELTCNYKAFDADFKYKLK